MNKIYIQRFNELEDQYEKILKQKKFISDAFHKGHEEINEDLYFQWKVKAKNILSIVCGIASQHFVEFEKLEVMGAYSTYLGTIERLHAVFLAAKEDYEGGYLQSIRKLIEAEVFDNQIEQAKELLKTGYNTAAAVIAGVVLETALRSLCDREAINHGKLDQMNNELAKKGVYSKLKQKQITAIADIRNSAAHGNSQNFVKEDVEKMIEEIERFLADYL